MRSLSMDCRPRVKDAALAASLEAVGAVVIELAGETPKAPDPGLPVEQIAEPADGQRAAFQIELGSARAVTAAAATGRWGPQP